MPNHPEALWTQAKVLRALAVRRKSNADRMRLFASASAKEREALHQGYVPKSEGRTQTETPERVGVPEWFRRACRALRCSKCKSRASVWWYASNGKRVRVTALAMRNDIQGVEERIQSTLTLCRTCAMKLR